MPDSSAEQLRASSSPSHNSRSTNLLRSRCLLLKVLRASGLNQNLLLRQRGGVVHGCRGAFVVVQVDEPFQQHSTHASASSGESPFWDQHFILYVLNSIGKNGTFAAATDVFLVLGN